MKDQYLRMDTGRFRPSQLFPPRKPEIFQGTPRGYIETPGLDHERPSPIAALLPEQPPRARGRSRGPYRIARQYEPQQRGTELQNRFHRVAPLSGLRYNPGNRRGFARYRGNSKIPRTLRRFQGYHSEKALGNEKERIRKRRKEGIRSFRKGICGILHCQQKILGYPFLRNRR